jgi:hypothetical protein
MDMTSVELVGIGSGYRLSAEGEHIVESARRVSDGVDIALRFVRKGRSVPEHLIGRKPADIGSGVPIAWLIAVTRLFEFSPLCRAPIDGRTGVVIHNERGRTGILF